MFLAQVSPPVEIASWLACAAFVIWATRNVIGLKRDLETKPATHEVQAQAAATFVTKPAFEAHVGANTIEHNNLFSRIGGMERGIRGELKSDFEKLSEALSDLSREVGGLKDVGEVRSQQMARLEAKMDRLAERITT